MGAPKAVIFCAIACLGNHLLSLAVWAAAESQKDASVVEVHSPHSIHGREENHCRYSDIHRSHGHRERSFCVSHDEFWLDGQPFQIVSGSMHYFRVHPDLWPDRLQRCKALGLNTIDVYIPWNIHEPFPGKYSWNGKADIERFLDLAAAMDLLVLLRIGPYICGEWTFGGFPWWLGSSEVAYGGKMRLRSSDPAFMAHVHRWWSHLLPRIQPRVYSVGGPIIMVQIENEYGSCGTDQSYLGHLKTIAESFLGSHATGGPLLYTTDPVHSLPYGSLRGGDVLTTVDFGPANFHPLEYFKAQKEMNLPGKSPPMCSEFYTGWLTHWGEEIANTSVRCLARDAETLLTWKNKTANVNFYMAHGGTNFGFNAGANVDSNGTYLPHITSYDYHAPISEAGDYCQPGVGGDGCKYHLLRSIIARVMRKPESALPPVPKRPEIRSYGSVKLHRIASLLRDAEMLHGLPMRTKKPKTFEDMGQAHGIAVYRCLVPERWFEDADSDFVLDLGSKVHDYAKIFLDGRLVGSVDRNTHHRIRLPRFLTKSAGYSENEKRVVLDIVVEAMGRQNFGCKAFGSWDSKGLQNENVTFNGRTLLNWHVYNFDLAHPPAMTNVPERNQYAFLRKYILPSAVMEWLCQRFKCFHDRLARQSTALPLAEAGHPDGPAVFHGTLKIYGKSSQFTRDAGNQTHLPCSYVDVSLGGLRKGIMFINGFNLGWYWPSKGPQMTLYVPGPILHPGENDIVFLETDCRSEVRSVQVELINKPKFGSPLHTS